MNYHSRRLLLLFPCRMGQRIAQQAHGPFPVLSEKWVELPPAHVDTGLAGSALPAYPCEIGQETWVRSSKGTLESQPSS